MGGMLWVRRTCASAHHTLLGRECYNAGGFALRLFVEEDIDACRTMHVWVSELCRLVSMRCMTANDS
jgi:hypothetical protein